MGSRRVSIETKPFESSESFLFSWEDDKSYDLLVLDIEMGKMNGLDLARRIRREDEAVPIMFITGYDEYMQYGYDVSALHYLIKPVNKTKLFMVLDKLQEKKSVSEKIFITTPDGERNVFCDRILYAEVEGHHCILHLDKETIIMKGSLSEFEELVAGQISFIKCHRAFIVNLKYVSMVLKADVVMDNGEKLPLSRNSSKKVSEAFIKYYRSK